MQPQLTAGTPTTSDGSTDLRKAWTNSVALARSIVQQLAMYEVAELEWVDTEIRAAARELGAPHGFGLDDRDGRVLAIRIIAWVAEREPRAGGPAAVALLVRFLSKSRVISPSEVTA